MGIYLKLVGEYQAVNERLIALKKNTKLKDATQNKLDYDMLHHKLKGIENKLLKLGIEHQVVKVTVKDGSFVYYTGLTAHEVTDILTNLGTVDWVAITPYNPGQFYKLKLEKM